MFVISQNRGIMINMDHVERVYVTEKEDNVLVVAVVHSGDKNYPVATLGRYATLDEAKDVLWKLMANANDYNSFEMPEGKKDEIVKDARVKRRGGS